jgi:hypothetical protein
MLNVDRRCGRSCEGGSTLVEALVATLVLATGLLAMAELVRLATAANVLARRGTVAEILAEQKLEQLRALEWGYDVSGTPVGDAITDTTVLPESATSGMGLRSSPRSLQQNTPGFVDHLDASGVVVGNGARAPTSAVYTRRWAIEPLMTSTNALLLQVLVTRTVNRGRADQGAVTRLPGDARLATLKVRVIR